MEKINHAPVDSGMLNSAGYDPATQTLEVEFKNGTRYRYAEVPPEKYQEFQAAESKGKYFGSNIRNQFSASKVPVETTA